MLRCIAIGALGLIGAAVVAVLSQEQRQRDAKKRIQTKRQERRERSWPFYGMRIRIGPPEPSLN